ncbi:MAG: T9SS type A sorting domain-containing protein [Fibrobacter sp.]|nr:T9SS type A sorting domain-containing protein [Fibrobacter sp.]
MKKMMFGLAAAVAAFAITPNPNLSIGKNLYVDGAVNSNWKPEVFTDGHLDFNQVASASDFALNVGEGPTKLFITWETRGDEAWIGDQYVHAASCQHNPKADASLQNFKVMTSANSTNGADGDWETVAEVGESGAMSRGLAIDFAGKSWFRIMADKAVTNLEEVGAYDMSKGGDDTWFFMGTSISQMGIKSIEVDSNFAQLIHARYPDYYPVMLRGGIGCVNTDGVIDGLQFYSEYVGNVKYWAIEMGTNDAWGDETGWNVEHFKSNMQDIIDVAKRNGVTPIIARMIATNPDVAKWQVHQGYLDAIDELTEKNKLPKGPDFFGYFSKHPEELSAQDGVHPAEKGAASMHRLWAEAMAPLYEVGDKGNDDGSVGEGSGSGNETNCVGGEMTNCVGNAQAIVSRNVRFAVPQIRVSGKTILVSGAESAKVMIMDAMGHVVGRQQVNGDALVSAELPAGNYVVLVRDKNISYSGKVMVK